ncbi:hypothetical protein E2C01_041012 [Portunus trituberculatus]|uniref:Uncharacterized protein n=1 Tax=Portunus trituberculatus TaxID=210409 RepID=A0A5B7FI29_PORTR|nr:hypothetical protein [Portunus trituberculatus]
MRGSSCGDMKPGGGTHILRALPMSSESLESKMLLAESNSSEGSSSKMAWSTGKSSSSSSSSSSLGRLTLGKESELDIEILGKVLHTKLKKLMDLHVVVLI